MGSNRIGVDRFESVVREILSGYEDQTLDELRADTIKVVQDGTRSMRAASRAAVGGKKYASKWTNRIEDGRLSTQGVVYNNIPGLPHLLEFGHVTRNGTGRTFRRTPAHPHIQAVEEEMVNAYIAAVTKSLSNG